MSVELNHTIVHARNNRASAEYLAGILGLEAGADWGPFVPVTTANGVALDFMTTDQEIAAQHYAFLVPEEEFDPIFERVRDAGTYFADPALKQEGRINHSHGGRGVYFLNPDGHILEVLTSPYGTVTT